MRSGAPSKRPVSLKNSLEVRIQQRKMFHLPSAKAGGLQLTSHLLRDQKAVHEYVGMRKTSKADVVVISAGAS